MTTRPPIPREDLPPNTRLRERKAGWRLWWEPPAAARAAGFDPVELDPARPTWSIRQAKQMNARAAAITGTTDKRTVRQLVDRYLASTTFADLKPATQRDYRQGLNVIAQKWGRYRCDDMTKPLMFTWYDTLRREKSEHTAAHLLRKMSVLMSYGELIGWVGANPCLRLKMKVPPPRQRIVTWEEQDHLVATADAMGLPSVATAILASVFQGQRETDLLELCMGDLRGALVKTQSKRGARVAMKLNPEFAARLAPRLGDPDAAPLLVDEGTGAAYRDIERFGKVYARVREAAATSMPSVASVQFRDFRRTFSTRARLGGASLMDSADAMGNQMDRNDALARTYNPADAEAADRAIDAAARPTPDERKKA